MNETITLPDTPISDLHLHEGDQAQAVVEVSGGHAFLSIISRQRGKSKIDESKTRPDFRNRLHEVFGERKISGPNPILEERNQSRW